MLGVASALDIRGMLHVTHSNCAIPCARTCMQFRNVHADTRMPSRLRVADSWGITDGKHALSLTTSPSISSLSPPWSFVTSTRKPVPRDRHWHLALATSFVKRRSIVTAVIQEEAILKVDSDVAVVGLLAAVPQHLPRFEASTVGSASLHLGTAVHALIARARRLQQLIDARTELVPAHQTCRPHEAHGVALAAHWTFEMFAEAIMCTKQGQLSTMGDNLLAIVGNRDLANPLPHFRRQSQALVARSLDELQQQLALASRIANVAGLALCAHGCWRVARKGWRHIRRLQVLLQMISARYHMRSTDATQLVPSMWRLEPSFAKRGPSRVLYVTAMSLSCYACQGALSLGWKVHAASSHSLRVHGAGTASQQSGSQAGAITACRAGCCRGWRRGRQGRRGGNCGLERVHDLHVAIAQCSIPMRPCGGMLPMRSALRQVPSLQASGGCNGAVPCIAVCAGKFLRRISSHLGGVGGRVHATCASQTERELTIIAHNLLVFVLDQAGSCKHTWRFHKDVHHLSMIKMSTIGLVFLTDGNACENTIIYEPQLTWHSIVYRQLLSVL
jgi:hypothetical protein